MVDIVADHSLNRIEIHTPHFLLHEENLLFGKNCYILVSLSNYKRQCDEYQAHLNLNFLL